jgi:hypothetical protein
MGKIQESSVAFAWAWIFGTSATPPKQCSAARRRWKGRHGDFPKSEVSKWM